MKKSLLLIPIFLILSILIVFTFNSSNGYKNVDFSKWNDNAKSALKGKTETELLRNITTLIGSEGEFRGTIKQYRNNSNQLIIEVEEDYIPDDSITSFEHRFIANKKDGVFEVVEYYTKIGY